MTPAPSPFFITRKRMPLAGALAVATTLLLLLAPGAPAQDRSVPGPAYFASLEEMYRGEYRRAERGFNNELRTAVRTINARWIDSASSYAMLGETLYRQGRHGEALEQFNLACDNFLANLEVFRRAQYPPLRPDQNRARRPTPWGPSSRQIAFSQLPPSLLVGFGNLASQQQIAQNGGGVVPLARLFRLNLAETVRAVALAMRRRTELLGPLSRHDRRSRQLDDRLSRGGIAPAGGWSNAWLDLLTGLAKVGVNKPAEATNYLRRATLLEGRYDHPLTGVALLAQAELAANNPKPAARAAAAQLLVEASLAGFLFEDFDVVERALLIGHANFRVAGASGPYPPLDQAIRWADLERYAPFSLGFRFAAAESLIAAGDAPSALALLTTRTRARDLRVGALAAQRLFLTAQAMYLEGKLREGGDALTQAFAAQTPVSVRGFQTNLTNRQFDDRSLSARIAVQVYDRLLSDPTPADWRRDPYDTLTSLRAGNAPAYARWFAARLGRREFDKAIEAADLAKRRRYLVSLPLGGRAASLQRLLEPPPGSAPLDQDARTVRESWLAAQPTYSNLAIRTRDALAPLRAVGPLRDGDRLSGDVSRACDRLADIDIERQRLLRVMALDRRSAPLGFPPATPLASIQASLQPGDAVLLFHQAADAMAGFLVVRDGHHYWRLPNTAKVQAAVADYLRELGAVGKQASIDLETAASADETDTPWRTASAELGALLLDNSRLELKQTQRLIIVPDNALWNLPFETLIAPGAGGKPLAEIVSLRVAPTLALAAPSRQPLNPVMRSAVISPKPSNSDRDGLAEQAASRLVDAASVDGVTADLLNPPLGAPVAQLASAVDLLVTTLNSELNPGESFAWRPVPASRTGASLAEWARLGGRAPQRLVLGGLQINPDSATGRRARRGPATAAPGNNLFLASCGLLASGTRTALISRWTTDGLTNNNLLREFTAESTHVPAPDAWRRSIALARETRLDPPQEPRLKIKPDDEPPLATHPYFWGGFLLLDTGFDPVDALPDEGTEGEEPKN